MGQRFQISGQRIVLGTITVAVLAVCVVMFSGWAPAQTTQAQYPAAKPDRSKTLYHRRGGYDVIADVVDDFLVQLRNDKTFERFGGGRGRDSLTRARQLIVDQVCSLTGGPCVYIGRDMKTAHTGLKITETEFNRAGEMIKNSLDKYKVQPAEQQEFMALIGKLKPDIVEPAAAKAGN